MSGKASVHTKNILDLFLKAAQQPHEAIGPVLQHHVVLLAVTTIHCSTDTMQQ